MFYSRNIKTLVVFLVAGCISMTACGSGGAAVDGEVSSSVNSDQTLVETSSSLAADTVVLIWTQTGGCAMAGPNCARYEISLDGAVNTYRGVDTEIANTGVVKAAAVKGWWASTNNVDFEALNGRLGPGELTAAYDGVDVALVLPTKDIQLSSVDVEFDTTEVFFASTFELVGLARDAAPLQKVSR